jgi:hypothetical protein
VETVFEGEEFCTDVASVGTQASGIGAREFESGFPGFGAAVGEEDAVEAADFSQAESEFSGVLVEEEVGRVDEALALTLDRFFDGWMGVAERGDADPLRRSR